MRSRSSLLLPSFMFVAGVWTHVSATTIIFNFNADPTGKATPFTDTVSGLSAAFSSSGDPGGFQVFPSFFKTLTGQVLFDPGPAGLDNLILTIQFSAAQSAISFNFATNSGTGVPLNLAAFNGASLIGSTAATGSLASSVFPEGVLSFTGGPFNRVVLSSSAVDFAIDNLTVTDVVPEPGMVVLFLAGILTLLGTARNVRSD